MAASASNGRYSPSSAAGACTAVAAEVPTEASQSSRADSGSGGPARSWLGGTAPPAGHCRGSAMPSCSPPTHARGRQVAVGGVDGDDLVQPGQLQSPEHGASPAGPDHQADAAHPAATVRACQDPDPGGAEEPHLA